MKPKLKAWLMIVTALCGSFISSLLVCYSLSIDPFVLGMLVLLFYIIFYAALWVSTVLYSLFFLLKERRIMEIVYIAVAVLALVILGLLFREFFQLPF